MVLFLLAFPEVHPYQDFPVVQKDQQNPEAHLGPADLFLQQLLENRAGPHHPEINSSR